MTAFSSFPTRTAPAALMALACALFFPGTLHADDANFLVPTQSHCLVRGTIRRIDPATDHLTLIGDDDHVYIVDAYDATVILPDITRNADTRDLERGMHIRATGTLVGSDLIEAATVRVVSSFAMTAPRPQPAALEALSEGRGSLLGVVRSVDVDRSHITVADADGVREIVDTLDATITLPGGRAIGQTGDLERGMRVQVVGTRLTHDRMVAEDVRVVPDIADNPLPVLAPAPEERVAAPAPALSLPTLPRLPQPLPAFGGIVPPSPDPQFVLANLDSYTGILIDTRHLSTISRSPAPNIFGPEPGESLLYPDRSHVPTPDEVQDESIVRYYRTEADAHAGVCGDHPLVLPAQAVLTPAQDSVQLSANDMVLFNALEQKLHFSRTWKVGFLIPGDK